MERYLTDGGRLMALLDEALDPAAAAALRNELRRDNHRWAEFQAIQQLDEDLWALGAEVQRRLPEADLRAEVAARLGVRSGEARTEAAQARDLIAWLDSAGDEVARRRFEKRLAADPTLRADVEQLRRLDASLSDLGRTHPAAPESVNLVQRVLRAVQSIRDEAADEDDLSGFEAELRHLGESWNAATPEVDLTGDVMASVRQRREQPQPSRVHTNAGRSGARRTHPRWWALVSGLAAAAVILGGLGFGLSAILMLQESQHQQEQLARAREAARTGTGLYREVRGHHPQAAARPSSPAPPARNTEPVEANATPEPPAEQLQPEPGDIVQAATGPTLQEVIEARRASLQNHAEALASLADWAALDPEQALALLEDANVDQGILLGAVQFLPAEEAAAILEAAVGQNPEDPHLRYALAKNLAEAGYTEDSIEQLQSWSERDPGNAMPLYMEAELLFAQGDYEAGLAALEQGTAYESASVYSVENAQHHRDALVASGMDPEVANYLAAFTAGSDEYQNLTGLSGRLLSEAQGFEEAGEWNNALDIYESVSGLGQQVATGAATVNETLAGLEMQQQAVDRMLSLTDLLGPEQIAYLDNTTRDLLEGIMEIGQIVQAANALILDGDVSVLSQYIRGVLSGGQLLFFDLY